MMLWTNSVPILWVELVNKLNAMHVAQSSFAVFDATEKEKKPIDPICHPLYEKVFKDFKHCFCIESLYFFRIFLNKIKKSIYFLNLHW